MSSKRFVGEQAVTVQQVKVTTSPRILRRSKVRGHLSLLARLLDEALGGDAAWRALRGRSLGVATLLLGRGSLGSLRSLLGRCDLAVEVGKELDRGDLVHSLVLDHKKDALDDLLDLLNRLALAKVVVELTENVDRGFEVLADGGSDTLCGLGSGHARSDLAGVLVEARLLRLLEVDVVSRTRELILNHVELTVDKVKLADLPKLLVVCGALVVLAAEEGPIVDVASAGLVATEVVGDHLARQVLGVLAGLAAVVLIIDADELAVFVWDVVVHIFVFDGVRRLIGLDGVRVRAVRGSCFLLRRSSVLDWCGGRGEDWSVGRDVGRGRGRRLEDVGDAHLVVNMVARWRAGCIGRSSGGHADEI